MKTWLKVTIFIALSLLCLTIYRLSYSKKDAEPTAQKQINIIDPLVIKNTESLKIVLGENIVSDIGIQNTSFEYLIYDEDKFAYNDGYRPYPWGGEIFNSPIKFSRSKDSHSGNTSYEIIGLSSESQAVLAVPDIELKPVVQPDALYYLSFWVKYDIAEGNGIRLMQQFFRKGDYYYPSYSCYGPWLKGKTAKWIHIGMLVRAPSDAWKGDPVIELWGKGELLIDDAYFGRAMIVKQKGGD